ncbi:MAG: NADH-quinone oxidoreductase subunit A [Ignavibacteria bacterium]|nr:NADH-quinone oxidoreductase subunit A [Ignavibacteria bacterium]
MIEQYIPLILAIVIALLFSLFLLKASSWFGPQRPNPEKLSTYESGMEPVRTARERFSVKFYIIAMVFIVFDIEVVFLYPWAINLKSLSQSMGFFIIAEMFIFIIILLAGYFYLLKKGALKWD